MLNVYTFERLWLWGGVWRTEMRGRCPPCTSVASPICRYKPSPEVCDERLQCPPLAPSAPSWAVSVPFLPPEVSGSALLGSACPGLICMRCPFLASSHPLSASVPAGHTVLCFSAPTCVSSSKREHLQEQAGLQMLSGPWADEPMSTACPRVPPTLLEDDTARSEEKAANQSSAAAPGAQWLWRRGSKGCSRLVTSCRRIDTV